MHILVTGATGRIGANLVKGLVEAGHRARAQAFPGDGRVAKLAGLGAEIVYGNVAFRGTCGKPCATSRPSTIWPG